MNKNSGRIMQAFWLICFGLFSVQPAWAATNISDTYKYAWSENVGWQNWRATNAQATVETTYLEGYVWSENIGWIKLGSTPSSGSYANSSAANWGVNRNSSTGVLSGYAWSENVGWINFNPTNGGVTTNISTGKFEGYAWGENIGWIHFQNASPEYYVQYCATSPPSPDPPEPPSPCSLSISSFNSSVTGNAGTTTYDVSNAVGYTNVSWTASVQQGGDWFTITSGATGTDAGTITCSFTANPSTAVARVAYIGIVRV